jgi:uncharacterized protein
MKCCVINYIAFILLIIGGLNWGFVGILKFDLVAWLLGDMTLAARAVYGLVGLAALAGIVKLMKKCKHCSCE